MVATECIYNLIGLSLSWALFIGSAFFVSLSFRLKSLPVWIAGQSLLIGSLAYYFNTLGFFPYEFSRGLIDILNAIFDLGMMAYYYWNGHAPLGVNWSYTIYGGAFALMLVLFFGLAEPFEKKLINQSWIHNCIMSMQVGVAVWVSFAGMLYLGRIFWTPVFLMALSLLPLLFGAWKKRVVWTGSGLLWLGLASLSFYYEMFLTGAFSQWVFPVYLWIGVVVVTLCFIVGSVMTIRYKKKQTIFLLSFAFHVLWIMTGSLLWANVFF